MMGAQGKHYTKAQMKQLKANFLEALKASAGLVTQACKKIGIDRTTAYDWRKKDPAFEADWDAAANEASEMALDLAESALMRNIQAGDIKAIKFYLQCKGKPRGYDLRQEIDLNATVTRPKVVFEDDEDAVQD